MSDRADWVPLGVAAALGREVAAEGKEYLPTLARLLHEALPDEAEPIQRGFLGRKTVVGVRVTLGDFRYDLDGSESGPVRASKTHIVRGIALKSEPLDIDAWLAEVGEALEERMRRSERIRAALSGMLGLG